MTEYENDQEYATDDTALFDADDPFAPKPKAISFEDMPVPTKMIGTLIQRPKVLRQLQYKTRKPLSWESGEPMQVAVVVWERAGKRESLWAKMPSALFAALVDATEQAGESMRPGGVLEVDFIGYSWERDGDILTTKPAKRRGMNASLRFTAEYTPPN
jgi:hypothetical protein